MKFDLSSITAVAPAVLVAIPMSLTLCSAACAQTQAAPAPITAEQDHLQMMQQLGVRVLRPGPSGDEKAVNAANYDEAKANPYPVWPDPLKLEDGREVTSAAQWWKQRRPQLVEAFEREVYGRVPKAAPKVAWRVVASETERVGSIPVTATQVTGHVDNSAYPSIAVDISMMLIRPVAAPRPMPVLIMFARSDFPAPDQPSPAELGRINAAAKAVLTARDPSLGAVFRDLPAYEPIPAMRPVPPQLNADGDPPSVQQLLADGWAVALLDPASIQADNGAGLRQGVIGLVNRGGPRKPDDWGALRAWAWGAGRAYDYLAADPGLDARHIGVEGVSRYGKAALVTMAFDPRFAMVLVGSSGEGGAKPHRRNFGEAVESLTSAGEYHWMAGNFLKYGASDAAFGARTADDLPVDAPELIALCAPRLTFISYGQPSKGDARWLDQRGGYMATVAAGKVFRLLGAKDLGVGDDYRNANPPPINTGLLDGRLAWRQHDGGHTDAPNMKYFIAWADRWMGRTPATP